MHQIQWRGTTVGSQNRVSGVKEFIKTDAVGASRCAHHDARASVVDSVAAHDIVRDRPASAVHVDGSFVTTVNGVTVDGIRTTAQLNSIEYMGGRDLISDDGTTVGGTGKWVGDKRDPELGISDRVPRNSYSRRGEDQNARRRIRGVGDGVGRPDVIDCSVETDFALGSEADLDGIFSRARSRALANHRVSGDRDIGSELVRRDSVLLIVLNVTVRDDYGRRPAVAALHEYGKTHLATDATAGQSLIDGGNSIYFSGSVLIIEADQIERGTTAAANPIIDAVDGEVADTDICGPGDQNLGRNRTTGRQAGCVLYDATWGSHDDRCVGSSALYASEGQRLVDHNLLRIGTRTDQDGGSRGRSIHCRLDGRESEQARSTSSDLDACGHQVPA